MVTEATPSRWSDVATTLPHREHGAVALLTPMSMDTVMSTKQRNFGSVLESPPNHAWSSEQIRTSPGVPYNATPEMNARLLAPVRLLTPVSMATEATPRHWSDLSTTLPHRERGAVALMTPVSMDTVMSTKQRNGGSRDNGHGVDLLTPVSMDTVIARGSASSQPSSLQDTAVRAVVEVQTPPSIVTDVCPGNFDSMNLSEVSAHADVSWSPGSSDEGLPWPVTRLFR